MDSLDYYKIEELLTEGERAVRDRAAQFVQKEVLSEVVPCHRAGKFPDHLIPRMGALRFYAPYLLEQSPARLIEVSVSFRRQRQRAPEFECH